MTRYSYPRAARDLIKLEVCGDYSHSKDQRPFRKLCKIVWSRSVGLKIWAKSGAVELLRPVLQPLPETLLP